jgi:alpha-L-arabinofuranosidase
MYQHMQRLALKVSATGPTFDSDSLGTIVSQHGAPYLDLTATRAESGCQVTLGLINRHPTQELRARINWRGFPALNPIQAWLLSGPDPLAANSFDTPEQVRLRQADLPAGRGD